MRKLVLVLTTAAALLVLAGGASADPGPTVTDDPAEQHADHPTLAGADQPFADAFLDTAAEAQRADRRARNISLVGALALDNPTGSPIHGDVAGYKNLAFVGKWRGACPGTGVDIIDISRPAAPVKVADTLDRADTSMEDMEAMQIGTRDVLGIGLQDCGNVATAGVGKGGLELYDVSDPANPQLLSFFDVDTLGGDTGVHELDLTTTPDGRTLALLTVPNQEAFSFPSPSSGDLLIVDISDPANPVLAGEWGVLDDPLLGLAVYLGVQRGGDSRTYLHGVRANQNGTLAYLSYWDAGFITLDISDPSNPVFLGRTVYPAGHEGNAHSLDEARGGNLLVTADEDGSPFQFVFTSNAFAGSRIADEAAFTPRIVELPGREMAGEVVHVGRGCPADAALGLPVADPYLADPAGKIALVERGLCRFDNKIARAQLAGATGVIVYNTAAGGEGRVLMGGNSPVVAGSPDVIGTVVTIPAVFVQRSTGVLLRDGTPPVTARAAAEFNGWGYMRIFNVKDPANPVELSTFATPNVNSETAALSGTWTIHNPEVRGNTVYASWYSDGVRVIDISQPTAPREIGFWTGAGAPAGAPSVNIWSVVPHGSLLLTSDRNYGLYVLKLKP